jgi:hypothetical protein
MSKVASIMGLASKFNPPTPSFSGSDSFGRPNGAAIPFYSVNGDYSGLEVGDFVVAMHSVASTANYTGSMTCSSLTSNGVSEVASMYVNDSYDTNLKVYAGELTSSPSSIQFSSVPDTGAAGVAILMWFKDVGSFVSPVTIEHRNTYYPDPASVSNLSEGDIVVCVGANAHNNDTGTFSSPTDLTNFTRIFQGDNRDTYGGIGTYVTPSGVSSFNANQWTTTSTVTALSSGSAASSTLVLKSRPY